ncbi:MAG TPA: hypothetical protein VJQ44_01980 [Gemmatimonadales bacterium]|nr:hypothetical protein [Gemmatimonadales bacterium]
MRRVRLLCGLTLVGVVSLAGCSKSAAEQAKAAKTTLDSWQATVQLLEQQQARGAVPDVYARQVRRAAGEARDEAAAQLRKARSP